MELMEAIKSRRSVRRFTNKDVEDEKLKEIFEAARWAPSWANTQCWEFIVVKNNETKKKISETLRPGNPATNAVASAPVVIVACGRKRLAGFYGESAMTDKGDWLMFDVALAIQNMCLAIHNLGLGTVIVGAFNSKKVAEILNVPENVDVVAILPVGYPEKVPKTPPRKNVEDFVFYESYGKKG
ncbi:MAG: nitroreductase family protein [Candidatus Bathyarchaeota archaeon]